MTEEFDLNNEIPECECFGEEYKPKFYDQGRSDENAGGHQRRLELAVYSRKLRTSHCKLLFNCEYRISETGLNEFGKFSLPGLWT